mmetsp:Transcript_49310/g.96738  ORF Transcript_49310/g.96738 Transcript_49310/m.96738 type:complete len:130 (-) Transcript_49310:825-1214(-)
MSNIGRGKIARAAMRKHKITMEPMCSLSLGTPNRMATYSGIANKIKKPAHSGRALTDTFVATQSPSQPPTKDPTGSPAAQNRKMKTDSSEVKPEARSQKGKKENAWIGRTMQIRWARQMRYVDTFNKSW